MNAAYKQTEYAHMSLALAERPANTENSKDDTESGHSVFSSLNGLKEWQVLVAGLLAILSAGLGLLGVHRQIRNTWNLEKNRENSQRKATVAALESELENIRYLAGKEAKELRTRTEAITPARLLESVPAECPVFHSSVDRLGTIRSQTKEEGALDAVLHAYALQARLLKSAQIMHATDPNLEIPTLKDRWPVRDLVALQRAAKHAVEALKKLK